MGRKEGLYALPISGGWDCCGISPTPSASPLRKNPRRSYGSWGTGLRLSGPFPSGPRLDPPEPDGHWEVCQYHMETASERRVYHCPHSPGPALCLHDLAENPGKPGPMSVFGWKRRISGLFPEHLRPHRPGSPATPEPGACCSMPPSSGGRVAGFSSPLPPVPGNPPRRTSGCSTRGQRSSMATGPPSRQVGAAGRPLACLMPVPPEFTATNPSPFPPWWSFVREGKPFAQPNQGRPSPAFFSRGYRSPLGSDFVQDTMDTLLAALDALPVYLLECRPDREAVELLREQMQP